jgi:hypothetical protein
MLQHLQDRYMINLAIDGSEYDTHLFRPLTYKSHLTTPLGFNYDSRISGSIAAMIDACDLVNIHALQHGEAPTTHKQGSQQIDFMFVSCSLVIHVEECGILPFDSMFSSDHKPIYVDLPYLDTQQLAQRKRHYESCNSTIPAC